MIIVYVQNFQSVLPIFIAVPLKAAQSYYEVSYIVKSNYTFEFL